MKERIEYLEKRLAELKAEYEKNQKPEQPERWQDKLVQPIKEDYWHISNSISKGLKVLENYNEDRKPEHAFRTEEQAELVKEKMLLMQEMHAFAYVMNGGWVADYEDTTQPKYGITHDEGIDFCVDFEYYYNYFVFGISVKSAEIAEEMYTIFRERLNKYYNQQY